MAIIIPAGEFRLEQEVKKSRFIAIAVPLDDTDGVKEHIERVGDPAATHNCWAYRFGAGYRFSDDGEPGGTAGRPILSAIDGQGVDRALVVVTRYFGGIKLGAGGLVRAYGGAAAECLRLAPKLELRPRIEVVLSVPFDSTGVLYKLIEKYEATKLGEAYESDSLEMHLSIEATRRDELERDAVDGTRGKVRFQWLEESL